jgi:four helix bundle protein
MAVGSTTELEAQLYLSVDLSFRDEAPFQDLQAEILAVRKLILGFKKSLKG